MFNVGVAFQSTGVEMVRIIAVGLSLMIFSFAAMVQPRPSQALCRCRCVEGEIARICSKFREAGDAQVQCSDRACPPVDVRIRPSIRNQRCRRHRVLRPRTGAYTWEKICMDKRQAQPADGGCKTVDFVNPTTGLYDSKVVCPEGSSSGARGENCKKVDFVNPSTGLYDTKTVCQ
jgi:gentisate 1,2-dioxygenase